MITELAKGRGLLHEVSGMTHLLLDLRHIGEEKIDERLPMIKEISMKLLGINPAHAPLPVRPAAHYTMGGIHENIQGQVMSDDSSTPVEGLWAAGECGCVSVHGANRLGSNSLSHCVIWGRITGEAAARRAQAIRSSQSGDDVKAELDAACGRLDTLLSRAGKEDAYQLRRELGETLDNFAHVYRDEQSLIKAETTLASLRERYREVGVQDTSEVFNTNLRDVLEIGSMLELAQTVAAGALHRKESRGSHARVEYPKRDDVNFLKHTLAYRTEGLPRLSYIPVARTKWEPMERKY
jgi:succinate dehydrogenase / fumarate reductase flavoprotein subunit